VVIAAFGRDRKIIIEGECPDDLKIHSLHFNQAISPVPTETRCILCATQRRLAADQVHQQNHLRDG
jgi:hypothetical protein